MKDCYFDGEHGVTVSLLHGDPYTIVSGVETNRNFRRQGYASPVVEQMIMDADLEGVTLVLGIESDGSPESLTNEQLVKWYTSFGFEVWKEDPDARSMIRRPQKLA